jgi:hypothetical protein
VSHRCQLCPCNFTDNWICNAAPAAYAENQNHRHGDRKARQLCYTASRIGKSCMKYLTAEWALGCLDEDACEAAVEGYQTYLDALDESDPVWRFVRTPSVHDAYLDKVVFDRTKQVLKLSVVNGDVQSGYFLTELVYSCARITCGEDVLRRALSERPSEIWYDEFAGSPRATTHSFLLAPIDNDHSRRADEFSITFGEFNFTQIRLESRRLTTQDDQSDWG